MPLAVHVLKVRVGALVRAAQRAVRRATVERRLPHTPDEVVALEDLGLSGGDNHYYNASVPTVIRRALTFAPPGPGEVLVDLGCGVGRVLDVAARRPYDRVVGVDLSEELCRRARENLAANARRHCCRVDVVTADLATWPVPDDVTSVYAANPVGGAPWEAVLDQLLASFDRRPRSLRLVYVNPEHRAQVDTRRRFRLVATSDGLRRVPDHRVLVYDVTA